MYLVDHGKAEEIQKEGLAESLVVVSQYEEILTEAGRQGIAGVKNPHSERGISSSLQIGLEAAGCFKIRDTETCYMFFVADQPFFGKRPWKTFWQILKKAERR